MRKTWLAAALALTGVLPARTEPPAPAPTIKVDVQEVLVDLVVRGRSGKQIRDLKPSDFEILENGVPQKLRSLRLIEGGTEEERAGLAASERRSLDPVRQLRLIVLAFDSMGVEARQRAKRAAVALMKQPMPPHTYFAVVKIDPRLRTFQKFTQDPKAVLAAVDRILMIAPGTYGVPEGTRPATGGTEVKGTQEDPGGTQPPAGLQSGVGQNPLSGLVEAKLAEVFQQVEKYDKEMQGARQLDSLLALVGGLRVLEGRKTVMYFSEGLERSNMMHLYNGLVGIANRSNVSFYGVDAGGLRTVSPYAGAVPLGMTHRGGGLLNSQDYNESSPQVELNPGVNPDLQYGRIGQGNLEALATDTGGFLLAETNDLGPRMKEVTEDAFSYWVASYQPTDSNWDGKFRTLQVNLKRGGLKVQSRNGYFAFPAEMREVLIPYEVPLLKALSTSPAPKAFDYYAASYIFRPGASEVQCAFDMEVPMKGLTFTKNEQAGTYDASLAFLVLIRDSTGQPVRKIRREVPFRGALERMEQYRAGNFSYSDSFSIPPGRYTMETVVLDRTGGRASVRRSVLMVPDQPAGVALGSLMLVKRIEQRGETVVPGDPFVIGTSKVVPQLSGVVSAASELPVFVSLFPDAHAQSAPTLRFEISKDGKSIQRTEQPLWPADESGRNAMVVRLPIANLGPGRYDLRAVARQGESAAEQRIAFEIQ